MGSYPVPIAPTSGWPENVQIDYLTEKCCCIDCCTSGTVPWSVTLALSGFANEDCFFCGNLNQEHTLTGNLYLLGGEQGTHIVDQGDFLPAGASWYAGWHKCVSVCDDIDTYLEAYAWCVFVSSDSPPTLEVRLYGDAYIYSSALPNNCLDPSCGTGDPEELCVSDDNSDSWNTDDQDYVVISTGGDYCNAEHEIILPCDNLWVNVPGPEGSRECTSSHEDAVLTIHLSSGSP